MTIYDINEKELTSEQKEALIRLKQKYESWDDDKKEFLNRYFENLNMLPQ